MAEALTSSHNENILLKEQNDDLTLAISQYEHKLDEADRKTAKAISQLREMQVKFSELATIHQNTVDKLRQVQQEVADLSHDLRVLELEVGRLRKDVEDKDKVIYHYLAQLKIFSDERSWTRDTLRQCKAYYDKYTYPQLDRYGQKSMLAVMSPHPRDATKRASAYWADYPDQTWWPDGNNKIAFAWPVHRGGGPNWTNKFNGYETELPAWIDHYYNPDPPDPRIYPSGIMHYYEKTTSDSWETVYEMQHYYYMLGNRLVEVAHTVEALLNRYLQ